MNGYDGLGGTGDINDQTSGTTGVGGLELGGVGGLGNHDSGTAGGAGGLGLGGVGSLGNHDSGTAGAAGGTSGGGSPAPSFRTIYSTILAVHCAGSKCHNPGVQEGIGFATRATAFNSISPLVTPGDGADSDFYGILDTGAMPKGGPKLSVMDLASIEAWIDGGALNN